MTVQKLAFIVLLAVGAAACGSSGTETSNDSAASEAGLEAENFSSTINSDDAVMNEADVQQLNAAGA